MSANIFSQGSFEESISMVLNWDQPKPLNTERKYVKVSVRIAATCSPWAVTILKCEEQVI